MYVNPETRRVGHKAHLSKHKAGTMLKKNVEMFSLNVPMRTQLLDIGHQPEMTVSRPVIGQFSSKLGSDWSIKTHDIPFPSHNGTQRICKPTQKVMEH